MHSQSIWTTGIWGLGVLFIAPIWEFLYMELDGASRRDSAIPITMHWSKLVKKKDAWSWLLLPDIGLGAGHCCLRLDAVSWQLAPLPDALCCCLLVDMSCWVLLPAAGFVELAGFWSYRAVLLSAKKNAKK